MIVNKILIFVFISKISHSENSHKELYWIVYWIVFKKIEK